MSLPSPAALSHCPLYESPTSAVTKYPKLGRLKSTEIYSLSMSWRLEVVINVLRGPHSFEGSRRGLLFAASWILVVVGKPRCSLTCGHTTAVSAIAHIWPSLCVPSSVSSHCLLIRMLVIGLGSTLIQCELFQTLIVSAKNYFQIRSHPEVLGGHDLGGGALFNSVQLL